MNFTDFIKKGDVRKGEKDVSLARSLVQISEKDIEFFKSLEINENSSRKIMSNFYDILRSILEAIAALDGFKIYSHEAFTYFLKEKEENILFEKFDRFRKIRNKINYYGEDISVEETKEIIGEIVKMINELKEKYLSDLNNTS